MRLFINVLMGKIASIGHNSHLQKICGMLGYWRTQFYYYLINIKCIRRFIANVVILCITIIRNVMIYIKCVFVCQKVVSVNPKPRNICTIN